MPLYDMLHWQFLVAVLLGGALLLSLLWLGVRARDEMPGRDDGGRPIEPEHEEIHFFGGPELQEGTRPVPLVITVCFLLFLVWALVYTLMTATGFLH
jgi:hypothetical protein